MREHTLQGTLGSMPYFLFAEREPLWGDLLRTAREPKSARKRLYWLHGQAGLGKSSLLEMLESCCKEQGIGSALLNLSPTDTELTISENLVAKLKRQGVHLGGVQKILDEHESSQRENRRLRTQVFDSLRGGFSDDESAVGRLLTTSGADMMLHPTSADKQQAPVSMLRRLATAFVEDLSAIQEERSVVLMLDDFDRVLLHAEWLSQFMHDLPTNTMLVITTTTEHLSWRDCVHGFESRTADRFVGSLSRDDLVEFAGWYFSKVLPSTPTNEQQLDVIANVSEGSPFWVSFLCEHGESIRLQPPWTPTTNLVNQLLGDSGLRRTLEALAVPRRLDEDLARKMVDSPNAEDVLAQVRSSRYITWKEGRWSLRSLVRDILNEDIEANDDRKNKLHSLAYEHYNTLIEDNQQNIGAFDDARQTWELERLYHQYKISPAKGEDLFINIFERAYHLECEYDFCQQLINEALSLGGGKWVDYYRAVFLNEQYTNIADAKVLLEAILKQPRLQPALEIRVRKYLATLLWFFQPSSGEDVKRAEELYGRSLALATKLEDETEKMVIQVLLGSLRQRTRGDGLPLYNGALKICERLEPACLHLQAWLEKELGDAYRLNGRFVEAERSLRNSKDHWAAAGREIDRVHAIRTLAMLYVYMGKVDEAERLFQEARSIFKELHFLRRWEDVWTNLGLGDVAIARGDFSKALELCRDALTKIQGSEFEEAVVRGQMAEVFHRQGNNSEAIEFAEKSVAGKERIGDEFGVGWACCTLGMALGAAGRYVDAMRQLERGMAAMKDYGSAFGQSRIAVEICRVHYLQGCDAEAFHKAAQQARSFQRGSIDSFHDHLAQVQWLEAFLQLKQEGKADRASFPLLAKEAGQKICLALVDALKHSVYLADFMVEDTKRELKSLGLSTQTSKDVVDSILVALDDHLGSRSDSAEKDARRKLQQVGIGHKDSVLDQLRTIAAELTPSVDSRVARREVNLALAEQPRTKGKVTRIMFTLDVSLLDFDKRAFLHALKDAVGLDTSSIRIDAIEPGSTTIVTVSGDESVLEQIINTLQDSHEALHQLASAMGLVQFVWDCDGKTHESRVKDDHVGEKHMTTKKRFYVALSFPGEHRAYVQQIADALASEITKDRVFYDKYHEAELARPDLDTYLQEIYHDDSELVVVVLCKEYDEKEWCGLEFRAIRDLIKKHLKDNIMFVRVADGDVKGVFGIDGFVDAKNRPAPEIARVILNRLELLRRVVMH